MLTRRMWIALYGLAVITSIGCNISVRPGGGGTPPTTLVAVTGRTIPDGQALALTFEPEADRPVTISVQADSDHANPDFRVVRGEVDFEDLQTVPIADLIVVSADEGSGEEVDTFTPETAEAFTLFVEDNNDWPGARFSVTITQR